jgi:hypothetical protein
VRRESQKNKAANTHCSCTEDEPDRIQQSTVVGSFPAARSPAAELEGAREELRRRGEEAAVLALERTRAGPDVGAPRQRPNCPATSSFRRGGCATPSWR